MVLACQILLSCPGYCLQPQFAEPFLFSSKVDTVYCSLQPFVLSWILSTVQILNPFFSVLDTVYGSGLSNPFVLSWILSTAQVCSTLFSLPDTVYCSFQPFCPVTDIVYSPSFLNPICSALGASFIVRTILTKLN
jgi:hypothetical protein